MGNHIQIYLCITLYSVHQLLRTVGCNPAYQRTFTGSIYRLPDASYHDGIDDIDWVEHLNNPVNCDQVILGDVNIDALKNTPQGRFLQNNLKTKNFDQLISHPTRVGKTSF